MRVDIGLDENGQTRVDLSAGVGNGHGTFVAGDAPCVGSCAGSTRASGPLPMQVLDAKAVATRSS